LYDQIAWFLANTTPSPVPEASKDPSPKDGHLRPRVLVVDDEHLIADTVAAILNANGFEAVGVYNGEEALGAARNLHPDIVISDVLMPRMSGVELGIELRKQYPATRIFLFSGQAATTELMRKAHADGYDFELFPKPIHPEELISRLRTP